MEIPGPDAITPEFLTTCLQAAGHPRARVRGFRDERVGTGQVGACVRYELDLATSSGDAPRSLVGKFPSDDPTSRQTAVALRTYLKEVSFYQHLQPRLSIRTPRCYYAAIDDQGSEFALILEDLAPRRQGDQLAGCSVEVARAAVRELVGLHAPSWCDAELHAHDWLDAPDALTADALQNLYRVQLPAFLRRFRDRLEPDEAALIEQVADSKGAPFRGPDDVFSLVHVDYRLDNLLIDERAPLSIAVVDWQCVALGNPMADVAYFLGAGLLPEVRREVEREIVEHYHEGLVAAGITGYGSGRCWQDYRRGAFAGLSVTIIAAPMVQRTERGDAMFTAMARRHARHALDLGSEEFLHS